jgi:hypothetical protein
MEFRLMTSRSPAPYSLFQSILVLKRHAFFLLLLVPVVAMMDAAITLSPAAAQSLSSDEARAIAREAYIYGFPLVDNYRIQYSYFVDRDNPEFKASWNTLVNNARVYTPDDKAIQTPNSDTPYSFVGADLRAEPLVFTVPQVDKGRYYSLQFIDQYTFDFAYVGSRATGNGAASYLLAGPNWKGTAPKGIAVIRSETQFVFVLYRTQLFDSTDIENVKAVQAGYKVQTLSEFLGQPAPPAAPAIDFIKPLTAQEDTSLEFFRVLNFILQFCPTHPSEKAMMARFAGIGVGAGKSFDVKALSPEMRKAIEGGMADAWATFKKYKRTQLDTGKKSSVDAFGTRQFLNGRYLDRFTAAVLGIYGNSKNEAIYPAYFIDSAGQRLVGAKRYALRFAPGQLPPANAFWSLTIYELPASLLSANPLNRYLINSVMLPGLARDADGGITLYVQNESPGAEKESNWLPAPNGPFFAVLRLYWPKPTALNGKWTAPPLIALSTPQAQSPAGSPIDVTVDNFVRAESDLYMAGMVKDGALGKFIHRREPASIDQQTVIRLNRDTLYSTAVFDLDAGPVTITLPDAGKRFMSMQVISEDHYVPMVVYGAGAYRLDKAKVGTRYVLAAVRTLVDPVDPKDVEQVHALQDAIKFQQKSPGSFEVPQWDQVSQKKVRDALLVLGSTIPDFAKAFGTSTQVDPVRHLIGTAVGWGGNPDKDAAYLNVTPTRNDGTTVYQLNIKDVPVDGFWSISVYNAEGYFQKNEYDAYTLNNITAKRSDDGSIAIQFGGCDGKIANCLPIVAGWNYTVRLYRPRAEILHGSWRFPKSRPVN